MTIARSLSSLKKLILLSLPILCCNLSAYNPKNDTSKTAIGLNAGWGAAYGTGISVSKYYTKNIAFTLGGGLSFGGLKGGFGVKYLINPENRITPFLESNIAFTTGSSNVTLTDNENDNYYGEPNEATFKYDPAQLIHLRTGLRLKFHRSNLYCNIGYGALLDGGESHYKSGFASENINDAAKILEPGGLELSAGISVKL